MAVIEICDICKKQVEERDGITASVSDMDGLEWIAGVAVRNKQKYEIRICDKCLENIKKYCRNNMGDENNFVEEFNKNKVSNSILDSCKKTGRLFGKK